MKLLTMALILAFCLPGIVSATVVRCEIPVAEEAAFDADCERLRLAMRIRAAEWDRGICATELLMRESRTRRGNETRKVSEETIRDDRTNALDAFDASYSSQRAVPSFCGVSIVDTEFGEQCDNGVNRGTLCTYRCQLP